MQYHKLNALIQKLSAEQDQFNYFLLDKDKRLISMQEGVFRTNCIDCLDRTNVVQSMIAWRSLSTVLQVDMQYVVQTDTYDGAAGAFGVQSAPVLNKKYPTASDPFMFALWQFPTVVFFTLRNLAAA